jgi:hypothetical protein
MPTSCSVAHAIANAVTDVPDAFDFVPDDLAEGSNVVLFRPYQAAEPTPTTLGECVPLLSNIAPMPCDCSNTSAP